MKRAIAPIVCVILLMACVFVFYPSASAECVFWFDFNEWMYLPDIPVDDTYTDCIISYRASDGYITLRLFQPGAEFYFSEFPINGQVGYISTDAKNILYYLFMDITTGKCTSTYKGEIASGWIGNGLQSGTGLGGVSFTEFKESIILYSSISIHAVYKNDSTKYKDFTTSTDCVFIPNYVQGDVINSINCSTSTSTGDDVKSEDGFTVGRYLNADVYTDINVKKITLYITTPSEPNDRPDYVFTSESAAGTNNVKTTESIELIETGWWKLEAIAEHQNGEIENKVRNVWVSEEETIDPPPTESPTSTTPTPTKDPTLDWLENGYTPNPGYQEDLGNAGGTIGDVESKQGDFFGNTNSALDSINFKFDLSTYTAAFSFVGDIFNGIIGQFSIAGLLSVLTFPLLLAIAMMIIGMATQPSLDASRKERRDKKIKKPKKDKAKKE